MEGYAPVSGENSKNVCFCRDLYEVKKCTKNIVYIYPERNLVFSGVILYNESIQKMARGSDRNIGLSFALYGRTGEYGDCVLDISRNIIWDVSDRGQV